jgi:hypothetical protein
VGGVLGVLIGGSESEWEMQRTGWGDRQGALCTEFTLVLYNCNKPALEIAKNTTLTVYKWIVSYATPFITYDVEGH